VAVRGLKVIFDDSRGAWALFVKDPVWLVRVFKKSRGYQVIFLFVLAIFYTVVPVTIGYILWFNKTHKPKFWEFLVVCAAVGFWMIAIVCGAQSFNGLDLHARGLYAVSMAALTAGLTIYGEMFNSFPTDTEAVKTIRTKIKSAIAIVRSLLVFLFTYGYFYA